MPGSSPTKTRSNFRHFFVRGLAILLPTVLTIWILMAAYGFVQDNIAQPINAGIRELVIRASPWPVVTESKIQAFEEAVRAKPELLGELEALQTVEAQRQWLRLGTRRKVFARWWSDYRLALDLIGLLVAIVLIYTAGGLLGSFLGRRLYKRGELLLRKMPVVKHIYPSVKQVTDFLVGNPDDQAMMSFNRVVAVQYPRKGVWSVGLVTGSTMRAISDSVGQQCMTVFIPSSPTPFTGYVITVPAEDMIDVPVSIEDALRFTVSGGVIIPPGQVQLDELVDEPTA